MPDTPNLISASRSTITLIEKIDALHHTAHVDTMDANAREFFALLTSSRTRKMSAAEFEAELRRLKDDFVKACAANATELHSHIVAMREKERETPEKKKTDLHDVVKKAQLKIVKAVEEESKKTRRTVKATAKKAVTEIRTNAQSEYDKRGPSSTARLYQIKAVIGRLKDYRADTMKLPKSLRNKEPRVWLHQACRDIWTEKDGCYPSADSLYVYCHRNSDKILSLAGI